MSAGALPPDPAGGAQSAPHLRGPLCGRERGGKEEEGKGREGKRRGEGMEGKRRGGKGLIGLPMCNPGYAYGRYCYFLITIHFIWGPRGQAFGWGPWPLPPWGPTAPPLVSCRRRCTLYTLHATACQLAWSGPARPAVPAFIAVRGLCLKAGDIYNIIGSPPRRGND